MVIETYFIDFQGPGGEKLPHILLHAGRNHSRGEEGLDPH